MVGVMHEAAAERDTRRVDVIMYASKLRHESLHSVVLQQPMLATLLISLTMTIVCMTTPHSLHHSAQSWHAMSIQARALALA